MENIHNIQDNTMDIVHDDDDDIHTTTVTTTTNTTALEDMDVSIVGGVDMPNLDADTDLSSVQHQVLEHIDLNDTDIITDAHMEEGEINLSDLLKADGEINLAPSLIQTISSAPVQQIKSINSVSVNKPISIAPKPAGLITCLKQFSLKNVQSKPGQDLGNKQLFLVNNKLKILNTNNQLPLGTQLIKANPGQYIQLKSATNLPKIAISAGSPVTGEAVRTLTFQKGATIPRFINLQQQQAPQFKVVSFPQAKQGTLVSVNSAIGSIKQTVSALKSPTKILPAPQSGNSPSKFISSSILFRQESPNNVQKIIKVDGGSIAAGSTLLTNVSTSQKINPQKLHQIAIQGKGMKVLKMINQGISQNSQKIILPTSSLKVAPIPIAPSTSGAIPKTAVVQNKSQILPKTYFITDMHNNVVQVAGSNKGQNIVMTTIPTVKKVMTKPQGKVLTIPMTIANQKLPQSFAVSNVPTVDVKNANAQKPDNFVKTKIEIADQEMSDASFDVSSLLEQAGDSDMASSDIKPKNKHVVMVPASYCTDSKVDSNSLLPSNAEIKQEYNDFSPKITDTSIECAIRTRKACNCTKSQCLKLYCDCFASGEFCHNCNCHNCYNNIENEEYRQKAIRSCLDRNPDAFRPKIGKAKNSGIDTTRRHNKGCNCKRSGCLKNYCECFEGKISCSANCKCVGCKNVEDSFDKHLIRKTREASMNATSITDNFNNNNSSVVGRNSSSYRTTNIQTNHRQPSIIMTNAVIDAVCQCLLTQAADCESLEDFSGSKTTEKVLEEFAFCLQDIINVTSTSSNNSGGNGKPTKSGG